MKYTLPKNIMQALSNFIADHLALNFPEDRWDDLQRYTTAAASASGYTDVERFILHMLSAPLSRENTAILAAHLTISETYFWREPQSFEALEQIIIPALILKRQNKEKYIKIWCAGCSTGEEPYSIAIALKRLIPKIEEWNILILATDINPEVLSKAATGEYGKWSFRETPEWLKETYFQQKTGNKSAVIPEIKQMVKFEYLNMAENIYPSILNDTNGMDVIFCRNMLMYFSQQRIRKVVRRLYNALVQGGYLIVSASELSVQYFQRFIPVNTPGMVLYQKVSRNIKNNYAGNFLEIPKKLNPFQLYPEPVKTHERLASQARKPQQEILPQLEIPAPANPDYDDSLILFELGNYAEVIHLLQKDDQTAQERLLLIRAFANTGNLGEAIRSCEQAISFSKLDPVLYYLYASILQENDQPEAAVASLKRAIYLDPGFVLAYYSLGNISRQLGNIKNARKYDGIVSAILNSCNQEDILVESEGITAGSFREIINISIEARE